MEKRAETGTGGIPRRAFNNPRAMESLGSSNLSNQLTGFGGIDRGNDFVNQVAKRGSKFGSSDWYERTGNEATRQVTRNATRQVELVARRGADQAQEATNALKRGNAQFATAEGIRTMRANLQVAKDSLEALRQSTTRGAYLAGAGIGEVSNAHAAQNTGVQASASRDFAEYSGQIVGKMDTARGKISAGIQKLERKIESSERKYYGQIRAATRGLGSTPNGDPFD